MTDLEIMALWSYAKELWATFQLADDDGPRRDVKLQAWRDVLGDLDADMVRRTMATMSRREFPPPPGELRRATLAVLASCRGEPLPPDPDQAWAEVRDALGRVGRYGRPEWSHPAIAAAVEALGWLNICNTAEDQISYLRATFTKYFEGAARRLAEATEPPMPALANLLGALPASARAMVRQIGRGAE